ncbi:hypothetical protein KY360_05445 [Candidatus Woesearchaeota archaeon]|nr:hypothetical protein [Candidatus Woesearchaeota archaeon]
MIDESRRDFLRSSARAGAGYLVLRFLGGCFRGAEDDSNLVRPINSDYSQIGKYKVEKGAVEYVKNIAEANDVSLEDACGQVLMYWWRSGQSHRDALVNTTNYRVWSLYPTIDSFSSEGFKKAFPDPTISESSADGVWVHMDTDTFRGEFSKEELETSLKQYERSGWSNYGKEPEFPYGEPVK